MYIFKHPFPLKKREKGSPGRRLIWGLSVFAYRLEGGLFKLYWGGGELMQKKGSPRDFYQISCGNGISELH